jgi:large subunit ribosomal protein L19
MIKAEILEKIKPGSTVRVFEKVAVKGGSSSGGRAGASGGKEGNKERTSRFECLVLGRKHGTEPGASFTVRATVAGVGVEKVYPIHSPRIDRVEVLSSPKKITRSKIYYVRELSRKAIRRKVGSKTKSDILPAGPAEEKESSPAGGEKAEPVAEQNN